jgi:uncharacterized protein (TIGR03435 family)
MLLLLVTCWGALAQTDGARPEFEVASIKLARPDLGKGLTMGCNGGPGSDDPLIFCCQNMSLRNLVTQAYSLNYFQVTAPAWMDTQLFNLSAKVPQGTTRVQFPELMRNLLVERFKLAVHRETRQLAKYDLVVAKNGPKLKEGVEVPAPQADDKSAEPNRLTADKDGYPVLAGRTSAAFMNGRGRMYQPALTMEEFAEFLTGQMASPVTDATGLKGKYEISLYWTTEPLKAADGDAGPTLMRALQEQLGLRLEAKKGPVDFLVVDHIEKLPTDN